MSINSYGNSFKLVNDNINHVLESEEIATNNTEAYISLAENFGEKNFSKKAKNLFIDLIKD